jgi:hypothetical protein
VAPLQLLEDEMSAATNEISFNEESTKVNIATHFLVIESDGDSDAVNVQSKQLSLFSGAQKVCVFEFPSTFHYPMVRLHKSCK